MISTKHDNKAGSLLETINQEREYEGGNMKIKLGEPTLFTLGWVMKKLVIKHYQHISNQRMGQKHQSQKHGLSGQQLKHG